MTAFSRWGQGLKPAEEAKLFGTAESRALIQIAAYTIYETGTGTCVLLRLQAQ